MTTRPSTELSIPGLEEALIEPDSIAVGSGGLSAMVNWPKLVRPEALILFIFASTVLPGTSIQSAQI
jgi:hypothetical protein